MTKVFDRSGSAVTPLVPATNHRDQGVSIDRFKDAFREHPAGVAVITADAGQGPVALTATSVASVSVAPPMLVFSVSELSSSTPTILAAETVVVHLLDAEHLNVAKLGSTSGVDRFADTSLWNRLPTGEPRFLSARCWIRGRISGRMGAGGSTIVAVEGLEMGWGETPGPVAPDGEGRRPLVYHDRSWHTLGISSQILGD